MLLAETMAPCTERLRDANGRGRDVEKGSNENYEKRGCVGYSFTKLATTVDGVKRSLAHSTVVLKGTMKWKKHRKPMQSMYGAPGLLVPRSGSKQHTRARTSTASRGVPMTYAPSL
jgi:hypothetical protein